MIKKGAITVDNQNTKAMPSNENNTLEINQAADLFSQLSTDAQDSIIDLIKSLLSGKQ